MKPLSKGVVLGSFCPLNNAYLYLILFAQRYVDKLTVVIDEHEADTISGNLRQAWLQELFPSLNIQRIKSKTWHKTNPADFSDSLVKGLRRFLPKMNGHIFCLEERGKLLATTLKANFVPLDTSVLSGNKSEIEIANDPLACWESLPSCVRPHYVRRICVFGPESTGKSTLARQLAAHFKTVAVPEYAYTYIKETGKEIDSDDMLMIARGQVASEDALAREANRLLFCDSDLVTSILWSGRLVGSVPDWLQEEANRRRYDLYLLTDIDVPWVNDAHRYDSKLRQAFFDRCLHELNGRKRHFVHVKGSWDERFASAISAVENLLTNPP